MFNAIYHVHFIGLIFFVESIWSWWTLNCMSINYIHQSAHEVNSNPENVKKKKNVWKYQMGKAEAMCQRKTYNKIVKKGQKRQSVIYKTQYTKHWVTRIPLRIGVISVPRKSRPSMLHWWHPSCYSCYKPDGKSSRRKGPDSADYKQNKSVIICNTYIS